MTKKKKSSGRPKREKNTNKNSHYVNQKSLTEEIVKCQEADQVSDKLAEMFIKITEGVLLRFPNAYYYGINEDIKQDCLLLLCQKYKNYDATRNSSSFSFVSTCVFNHMRYHVKKAKVSKDRLEYMSNYIREKFDDDFFSYHNDF